MNYLISRGDFAVKSIFADIFFKDLFDDNYFSPMATTKNISYPVDIYESETGLGIDIACVGLDRDDIKIDIKDDVITIGHNKKTERKDYAYRGITTKSFNLSWRINDKFDLSKTEANLEKGLLTITIPLSPERKPKEISISIK